MVRYKPLNRFSLDSFLSLLISLSGGIYIWLTTHKYGAGLSPDSVSYISTARHLIEGKGFKIFNGSFFVSWPPLYPTILAVLAYMAKTEPIKVIPVFNAICFAFVLFLTAKYISKINFLLQTNLVFLMYCLFAWPLIHVFTMSWSEPLFIFFILLTIFAMEIYYNNPSKKNLFLLSSLVAMSILTRYIGVTLFFANSIIFLARIRKKKNLMSDYLIFCFIALSPIAVWFARNYLLTNTIAGDRPSSIFSIADNIFFALHTIINWYVPQQFSDIRALTLLFGIIIGYFFALSRLLTWSTAKEVFTKFYVLFCFIIMYLVFLILSASITAIDIINDRLLSPVYLSIMIISLYLVNKIILNVRGIQKITFSIFLVVTLIFLAYPTVKKTIDIKSNGVGANSKRWLISETMQFLKREKRVFDKCFIYSNEPWAIYIQTELISRLAPYKHKYNSPEKGYTIEDLKAWPKSNCTYLVWFKSINRGRLYTPDELEEIVQMQKIREFNDSIIYKINKR